MAERRYNLRLDDECLVALRRLANKEERTMAGQVRFMIRKSAMENGVWHSGTPDLKITKRK